MLFFCFKSCNKIFPYASNLPSMKWSCYQFYWLRNVIYSTFHPVSGPVLSSACSCEQISLYFYHNFFKNFSVSIKERHWWYFYEMKVPWFLQQSRNSLAIISSLFDNMKIVQVNITLLVVSGNWYIYDFILHLVHEIKMVAYFLLIPI